MMSIRRRVGTWIALCAIGAAMAGVGLSESPGPVAPTVSASARKPFVVFDATLYKDKPSLGYLSVRPLPILYEHRFWPAVSSKDPLPSESQVRLLAGEQRGSPQPVVIDIERWPLKGDEAAVQATVRQFVSVLSWFKGAAPEIRVGLYGTIPVPDYWRAIRDPGSTDYHAWQRDNDRLGAIVSQVDALFPSIYTFYPDRRGWVTYAIAQIREARRNANGKPVYAFLMPLYHESNRLLGGHRLDADYWELELETVYDHADGVVIWGGWGDKGPEPWDEAAPWWQATKRFLASIAPTSLAPSADVTAR